jgi:preprotein translocase subunit YajC
MCIYIYISVYIFIHIAYFMFIRTQKKKVRNIQWGEIQCQNKLAVGKIVALPTSVEEGFPLEVEFH